MQPLTPLHALLVLFAAVQISLAWILTKDGGWRRPDRFVSAILFVLNGLIGLLVATQQVSGITDLAAWPEVTVRNLDIPTNFLLILLVPILLRDSLAANWTWWTRIGLAACGLVAAANTAMVIAISPPELGLRYTTIAHMVPISLAYGGLLIVLAYRFARAGHDMRLQSFLLFGWGARPLQIWVQEEGLTRAPALTGSYVGHAFVTAAVLFCIALTALSCWRRQIKERVAPWWVLGGLLSALALGWALRSATLSGVTTSTTYAAAQLISLVAIRPLLVGYAYAEMAFLRSLVPIGITAASLLTCKAAVAATFSTDPWGFGPADAIVLPLAALLAWGLFATLRRIRQTPKPNDQRILEFLLDQYRKDPARAVSSADIAEGLQIKPDNVARDLERARTRLLKKAAEGMRPNEILAKIRPLRGQGYLYRLTERGAALLADLHG